MLYIHVDIIYEKMYVYVDDCTSLNKMSVLFCSVLYIVTSFKVLFALNIDQLKDKVSCLPC